MWHETGILDKFPEDGPRILWRAPAAWGYAGPAVANGRGYVMDYVTDADLSKLNSPFKRPKVKGKERVRSFDPRTRYPHWTHDDDCPSDLSHPALPLLPPPPPPP